MHPGIFVMGAVRQPLGAESPRPYSKGAWPPGYFTSVTATSPTICRLFAEILSNVSCSVWW